MTVNVSYRELMRMGASKLRELLSEDSLTVSVDGVIEFDVRKHVDSQAKIPIYNPAIHKAGDRVLVLKGKEYVKMVVPDLDADGRPTGWE